ncbi:MAG TPA: MAPEG family protein [Phenylobacterium sp.]|uniref:MAPEG family protein n=1 Tax=Phenylobacterium sp. TaxID=1871053 RepID=UPI002BDDD38B|nr:MAPEG family protein [Phenylobacterium sp.]HSV02518.1 MAPEG family protein [Phenylobacterium sp.]
MNLGTTPELKLLIAAIVIGILNLVWATVAGSGGARDTAWLMGPRDDPRPATGVAARLERAFGNFAQTFPLYAAALFAALLAGKAGTLTLWGSWLYVGGRLVYVPLYAAGTPVIRTLAWTVSMIGVIVVIAAFFE